MNNRICIRRRAILFLLSFVCTLSVFSQKLIIGTVRDVFLKTPLLEAKVSLLLAADSTVVIESIPIREKRRLDDGTLEEAQFWIEPERKTCKYLIRATP